MNILIFSITYFPFVGGAEVAVREITDRIGKHTPNPSPAKTAGRQEGNYLEFYLITAKLDKKLPNFERIGNVNVYRVGWGLKIDKYFYPWLAFKQAVKSHKQKKYVIAQAIMANYAGLAALLFKLKNKNVKYLLTEQSGDSDFFIWIRTWFWYPLYKMIYSRANYVQPISNWLAKRVRRYGYKGEIDIVPNGADVEKFKIKNEKLKIENLKLKFKIKEDDKVIITVSRLVEKNGVEYLIKAIDCMKHTPNPSPAKTAGRQEGNIKLLIAGIGKLESKLKKLVNKLGLQDSVIFLGNIGHNELPKYLWASDIFCRPSLTEGFGNVFVEAMAAGLPVIATQVGGIPDFLIDGETGLFCKVRNPKSIADAVMRLLNDKALYDRVAENGMRLVKERYDWDGIAGEMRNIYEKLILNL